MSQAPGGGTKKKPKGRQPAHMNNQFAFRHNPKSKKTDKILQSVNQHCCRRCHDKIEWRKKYRKYKPLTQPGSCNICRQKRVKAAYHTICTKCTTSDQAWKFCREAKVKVVGGSVADIAKEENQQEGENDGSDEQDEGEIENKKLAATLLALASKPALRCCAVCVKEVALRNANGDGPDVADIVARMGPMALRERRGLERQLLRQQQQVEGGKQGCEGDDDNEEEEDAADDESNDQGDEAEQRQSEEDEENEEANEILNDDGNYQEEDDPFLKAVGGAENLLTGDAYQEKVIAGEKPTTM